MSFGRAKALAMFFLCLVLAACGEGSGPRHKLEDGDKTFNAFISAVRDYYATRDDGTLSEPQLSDSKASFFYRYKMVKGGNHTEQVTLTVRRPRPQDPDARDGTTWKIGAWHHKDGADPAIPEVAREVERRTLELLAPAKP